MSVPDDGRLMPEGVGLMRSKPVYSLWHQMPWPRNGVSTRTGAVVDMVLSWSGCASCSRGLVVLVPPCGFWAPCRWGVILPRLGGAGKSRSVSDLCHIVKVFLGGFGWLWAEGPGSVLRAGIAWYPLLNVGNTADEVRRVFDEELLAARG